MKNLTTIIFILFLTLTSGAQSDSESEIIDVLFSEQNQYETCRKHRFQNNDLIKEITLLKELRDRNTKEEFKDDANIFDNENYWKKIENDSLILEGIYINFSESNNTLKKKNKKRIKKTNRCKDKHYMTFSYPIFSIDKNSAFVYMTTFCGSLCGIGELWILKKVNGNWKIFEKQFRFQA